MVHQHVRDDNSGDHWGVSSTSQFFPGKNAVVLAQLQASGEQVRLILTAEQAEDMAAALLAHAAKARQAEPIFLDWTEAEIAKLGVEAQANYRAALLVQQRDSASTST